MYINLEHDRKIKIVEKLKNLKHFEVREKMGGLVIDNFIPDDLSPNYRIVINPYCTSEVKLETSSGVIPDEEALIHFGEIYADYLIIKDAFKEY